MIHRTDIIGNGASNSLYTPSSLNVIACNVPQHGHRYNSLSIIDNLPITWMKNNSYTPMVPVYCTQAVKDYAKKSNINGDWFAVYERTSRWNSGVHAADYAAKHSKEIHLWGFDSMYSDDLTSQMDELVPRPGRPPLNKHWHPIWQEVFKLRKDVKFVLHCPTGSFTPLVAENLVLSYHNQETMVNNVEG
jgi:hypothetical protein